MQIENEEIALPCLYTAGVLDAREPRSDGAAINATAAELFETLGKSFPPTGSRTGVNFISSNITGGR